MGWVGEEVILPLPLWVAAVVEGLHTIEFQGVECGCLVCAAQISCMSFLSGHEAMVVLRLSTSMRRCMHKPDFKPSS